MKIFAQVFRDDWAQEFINESLMNDFIGAYVILNRFKTTNTITYKE